MMGRCMKHGNQQKRIQDAMNARPISWMLIGVLLVFTVLGLLTVIFSRMAFDEPWLNAIGLRAQSMLSDEIPKDTRPYRVYLGGSPSDRKPWKPFASSVLGLETTLREVLDDLAGHLTPCLEHRKGSRLEPVLIDVSLKTYAIRLSVEATQINLAEHAKPELECLKSRIEAYDSVALASISSEIKENYEFRIVVVSVSPGISGGPDSF